MGDGLIMNGHPSAGQTEQLVGVWGNMWKWCSVSGIVIKHENIGLLWTFILFPYSFFLLRDYPCVDHMTDIISSPFHFPYHSNIPPIYAYHIPILSRYYFRSLSLLSYASIFHLIFTASHLFDYLCTFYILSYCSTTCSLPMGRSTPLISWHYPLLSFLLSSKYSLHSY